MDLDSGFRSKDGPDDRNDPPLSPRRHHRHQQQQQQQHQQSHDSPSNSLGTTPSSVDASPHSRQLDVSGHGGDPDHHEGDGGSRDPHGGAAAGTTHDHEAELRKLRACEACRGLKVRCEPNEDGPCKRCKKAGRACVVTAPNRKRQKKTDSRVAELEKKIDALTQTLQARGAPPPPHQSSPLSSMPTLPPMVQPAECSATSVSPPVGHLPSAETGSSHARMYDANRSGADNRYRAHANEQTSKNNNGNSNSNNNNNSQGASWTSTSWSGTKRRRTHDGKDSILGGRRNGPGAANAGGLGPTDPGLISWQHDGDLVDRGILSMDQVTRLFARFTDEILPHMPVIVLPEGTTAARLRIDKPSLFLAVMAAATGQDPVIQRQLQRELMLHFAECVFLTGMKSLELVQALHIAVMWYWPPDYWEELKFYQLIHISALMAIDIGLGRTGGAGAAGTNSVGPTLSAGMPGSGLPYPSLGPTKRQPPPDPTTLESRRTWLTCYYLAVNTFIALHRPNLIRWSEFLEESVEILRNSPDAAPSDEFFCHMVMSHRLGEEAGIQLSTDDLNKNVKITDVRTQYVLRGLDRDLERFWAKVPADKMLPNLKIGLASMSLYMHEIALRTGFPAIEQYRDHMSIDPPRPPAQASSNIKSPASDSNKFNANAKMYGRSSINSPSYNDNCLQQGDAADGQSYKGSEPLSAAHINAISACLGSIETILDTFLDMEILSIRCLPVLSFTRIAYAIVTLIKMYSSSSTPGSELGKVIAKEDMRVMYYLDALLDKFRAAAADDRCRPAAKFLFVMVMLKTWLVKQGGFDGQLVADESAGSDPATEAVGGSAGGMFSKNSGNMPFGGGRSSNHFSSRSRYTASPQAGSPHQQQQTQVRPPTPRQTGPSTPLQLLSEVATTGRESPSATSRSSAASTPLPASSSMYSSLPNLRQSSNPVPTLPYQRPGAPSYPLQGAAAAGGGGGGGGAPGFFTGGSMDAPAATSAAMSDSLMANSGSTAPDGGGVAGDFVGFGQGTLPFSNWMASTAPFDVNSLARGMDLEGMGVNTDPQEVLNEPWFSDIFMSISDNNSNVFGS